MKPKPITDRQISSRIVYAVVNSEGCMDANRIFMPCHMEHALDLARALSEAAGEQYLTIPIILK